MAWFRRYNWNFPVTYSPISSSSSSSSSWVSCLDASTNSSFFRWSRFNVNTTKVRHWYCSKILNYLPARLCIDAEQVLWSLACSWLCVCVCVDYCIAPLLSIGLLCLSAWWKSTNHDLTDARKYRVLSVMLTKLKSDSGSTSGIKSTPKWCSRNSLPLTSVLVKLSQQSADI